MVLATVSTFANSSNTNVEFKEQDCHEFACQFAEEGAAMGGDIEDLYEMAYEYCNE